MDSKKIVTRNIEWKIHNFTKELAIEGKLVSTSNLEVSYDNKVTKGFFNGFIQDNRLYVNPEGEFVPDCMIHSYSIKLYNHNLKDKFSFQKSILLDIIFVNPNLFLKDQTLTVLIEAEFVEGLESVTSESNHHAIFRSYFKEKSLRDFTFYCSYGSEIKAHRVILAAASPTLKRMVENGSSVKVDDIDEDIMTEILRYIYTDDIFGMRCNTSRLMHGAEKFGLEGLKIRCAKYLVKYLLVENAVYSFLLAYKYNMKYMLYRCAQFINSNHKAIVAKNIHWKQLDNDHLTLLLGFYRENPAKVLFFESSLVKKECMSPEE